MSKRCEKCGDSFLCAEHAQVPCGLSCPPDWPGHWRDWHSEDHNCATKGRAAAAKREPTGGTTTELIAALRERLAAAEKKLELKWLIEEQLGAALARAETAERELDEALRRVDTAHEWTGNAWAETERITAERDRLREILRRIASMDQPDTCVDCSTLYPGDGASWCWFCTAREALGVKP